MVYLALRWAINSFYPIYANVRWRRTVEWCDAVMHFTRTFGIASLNEGESDVERASVCMCIWKWIRIHIELIKHWISSNSWCAFTHFTESIEYTSLAILINIMEFGLLSGGRVDTWHLRKFVRLNTKLYLLYRIPCMVNLILTMESASEQLNEQNAFHSYHFIVTMSFPPFLPSSINDDIPSLCIFIQQANCFV